MDPHSIKRQRVTPPSPTFSPIQTTSSLATPPLSHDHSREITLTQLPVSKPPSEYNPTLSRKPSYSNRHSKDTLFHKDTHHRHLPKQQQLQQQQQCEREQHEEWSPLRQAHEEFHQQRLQHLAKQRQLKRQRQLEQHREQHQHQHQQRQDWAATFAPTQNDLASPQARRPTPPSSFSPIQPQPPQFQTPSTSPCPSPAPPPSEVHPHTHYHFFTPGQQGLRFQHLGTLHNRPTPPHLQPHQQQRRLAPHPTAATFLRLTPPSVAAPGVTGNASAISPFSPYFGRRTQQFSDWLAVKERERARVESNLSKLRETSPYQHPVLPSAHVAKDNLKRLHQKIQQRRARARATLLYDLHQGVKTVEAQVQKQVEMVLSRLKDAPGSRYAFALTNTFLNTLPSALSQTIIPSAISAVAATAATKATNMTALRNYGEHDDEDDDEDEDVDEDEDDEDDEEKMWLLWQLQQQQLHQDLCYSRFSGYQPEWLQLRLRQQQIQNQSTEHLSTEFGTIAIAPSSSSSERGSVPPGSEAMDMTPEPISTSCPPKASPVDMPRFSSSSSSPPPTNPSMSSERSPSRPVQISSQDASVLLSAGSSTSYASAASAVVSAAASGALATIDSTLPSFIPTVVAPIVCVFSYPTPPTSSATTPHGSSPSSPSDAMTQHTEHQRRENLYDFLVRDHSVARGAPSLSSSGSTSASTFASPYRPTYSYDSVAIKKEDEQVVKVEDEEAVEEIHPRPVFQISKSNAWTKAEREALFLAATRFKLFGQWGKIKEMMNLHRTEEEIEREYRRLYVDDDDVEDSDLDNEDDGRDSTSSQDGDDEDNDDLEWSTMESSEDADDEAESGASSEKQLSHPRQQPLSKCGPRFVDGINIDQLPKKTRRDFLRHRVMMKRALKQQKSIRLSEKEFLIDKRFHLEEIPMHL